MQENGTELFNARTIARLSRGTKVTAKQEYNAREWLQLLQSGALDKEKRNYFKFAIVVLQNILGYSIKDELEFEEGNVEFSFRYPSNQGGVCIEVKGTLTKDLFSDQSRQKPEHRTPITQTWDYMGSGNFDYGISTNYRDFVLIDRLKGYSKYHHFDFMSIKEDENKLKEFLAVFSKESILEKRFIPRLYQESAIEERIFTAEFYKLYHETRLMLLREFQENGKTTQSESLHYAQLFLNRLIFLFFAQGTGKIHRRLFAETILQSLNPALVSEYSRYASDTILNLFERLDKGSRTPVEIFGFNGGLFSDRIPADIFFKDIREPSFFRDIFLHSSLKKQIRLDEVSGIVVSKFRNKLTPLITNLLLLSSFDFQSELNVNILGHVFEQSITDLEELQKQGTLRRKKEGIFYTPDFVTDFICRNAIVGYLSKNGSNTVEELILEYSSDLDGLEERLNKLRILDPACGSGHFLLKAVDVLLEIYKAIQTERESRGRYAFPTRSAKSKASKQFTLTRWSEETEARRFIENNIYGVDINEESVEITKLALFLKIASPGRKLLDLSQNIKVGNSVVSDKAIDAKAFDWREEFPDVLHEGRFNVIVGNPPYIRVQFLNHAVIDWLKEHKATAYKRVDISTLFFELAKDLLCEGGVVSYISSNQFLVTEYGRRTRGFLRNEFKIKCMIDFGDLPIFEDASTYVSIFTLQNKPPSNFNYLRINTLEEAKAIDLGVAIPIDVLSLTDDPWVLKSTPELEILKKLHEHAPLSKIGHAGTGIITGLDDVLLFNTKEVQEPRIEDELLLPVLRGTDPDRYLDPEPSGYVLYPYKLREGKTTILDEEELKRGYPNAYRYLDESKEQLLKRRDSRRTFTDKKHWYGLTRSGRLENFHRPKIVTPGEVRAHKFTLDKTGSGFLCARVFSVTVDDLNYDIRYVLGILNSSVARFYLQNTAPLKRGGYYTYSSKFLNDVPIPYADGPTQSRIIEMVDRIMSLTRAAKAKKDMFLGRLKSNLGATISSALAGFEASEFQQLMSQLAGQKIKLGLLQQDEWERYFVKYRDEILALKSEIKVIETSLDESVAELYGLRDERRTIFQKYPATAS